MSAAAESCSKIMDMIYEYSGNEAGHEDAMPLLIQIQIGIHTFFCQTCAKKIETLEKTREILKEDFFPSSPGFEDSIMARIKTEEEAIQTEEIYAVPGGISTRGWIIAGVVIIVSLVSAFFSIDFKSVATESGKDFLLPIGLTFGGIITAYCAFFIGSHIKNNYR